MHPPLLTPHVAPVTRLSLSWFSTALAVLLALTFTETSHAAADSVLVFSEIHYHPKGAGETEWIELHSLQGVNVDVSGWRIEGGVDYTFPTGTVIPGGGYVVVAANPAALPGGTAFGPFTGQLDNKGEELRLVNNSGRVMDLVSYEDGGDWPVGPDGSGATLVKIEDESADNGPSRWTTSPVLGGSPGGKNFPLPTDPPTVTPLVALTSTWKYLDNNTAPPADWKTPAFADGAWQSGTALLYAGTPNISSAGDGLYGYWPLEETAGGIAPNLAPGGTPGTLFPGAMWYMDETRGKVLNFDGGDGYVNAGSLPKMTMTNDFTLTFWANSREGSGSNVIIGNRHAPSGGDWSPLEFIKFTPSRFEFYRNGSGQNVDYTNFALGLWEHHALVKQGALLTYYRNGVVSGSLAITRPHENVQPFYFGGDKTDENWAGKLDDIAVWTKALPSTSVSGLASGSLTPLTAPTGSVAAPLGTQVAQGPVTHYFRRSFTFTGARERTTLKLQHLVDDGAIFYLNGTEVFRVNLPAGPVSHTTTAISNIGSAILSSEIPIPVDALVNGNNVLAVEVHQHASSADLVFGASLVATQEPAPPRFPGTGLVFNEISGANDPQFRIELLNTSAAPVDLAGYQITSSSGAVGTLATATVAPGGLVVITAAQLGFTPRSGDSLFLLRPGGGEFEDAQAVTNKLRGRATGRGRTWLFPSAPSFGSANTFSFNTDVVINELMYNPHPHQVAQEQWLELFNRGTKAVNLGGWALADGVSFTFPPNTILAPGGYLVVTSSPAGFAQNHPGIPALGPFSGKLSKSGERIRLKDAAGNPVDEVRYYDAGRWDDLADGGGSSLERRNAFADSSAPEAWAASDESGRAPWQTITYSGSGANIGNDPTKWNEFVFGLLSKGSFLIDDISVVEDPAGARTQLIQNGNFSSGQATKWRLLGTHRHGKVITEGGNSVLRVDASGLTEHMHNHVETTLKSGATFATINPAKQYEISFRAKWLGGNNLLNTRLYFNRLARTTALAVSPKGGTPGAANSRATPNLGPTYHGLKHAPAVPAAGEAATVSVRPSSPVGLGALTLFYAVDGGNFSTAPMSDPDGDGVFEGIIPAQSAGTTVQFYVRATDTGGGVSFFPAGGVESRALIPWSDGEAGSGAAANFRLVMLMADSDFLHNETEVMSADPQGATVIYREREIYYNVGVRLKGSQRGRAEDLRVGWHLRFPPHDAFLGAHQTMTIDRSGAGAQFSQKEILVIHALNRAGNIPGSYDDLIRVIAPRAVHTGPAMLQKARFSDVFLDNQWPSGAKGPMFEYELIYYPTTTNDGTPEGLKRPQPDDVIGVGVTSLGTNKEWYRWHYLQKNNRQADNYSTIMVAATAMGMSGAQFHTETRAKLDVDQWLRTFALQQLFGIGDSYASGGQHNAVFYTRPTDGKTLYFPKDMDFTFAQGTTSSIASGDLSRLIGDAANKRAYYGHLLDIMTQSFNAGYLGPWAQHYTSFLEGENLTQWMSYVAGREASVRSQISSGIAPVDFAVTTNNGQPLNVSTPFATIQGTGWVDVREIRLAGSRQPLEVTWTSERNWRVAVPVASGTQTVTLEAVGFDGTILGTVSIIVTKTGTTDWPALRINEFMASNQSFLDPADNDADDWIELYNPTAVAVSLQGWRISDGGTPYVIPTGYNIPAGGFLLIWADDEVAQNTGSGQLHVPFKLSASGETITLYTPDGTVADEVSFGPQVTDQSEGRYPDGAVGQHRLTYPSPLKRNILTISSVEYEGSTVTFTFSTTPGVRYQPEVSDDLLVWQPLGTVLTATTSPLTVEDIVGAQRKRFYRVRVEP